VDGNQVVNDANANLKTTEGGLSGVDLRTIPAENIKSVEVITGIPSVEYGNFSNGIVKVETKSGVIPPKLNVKINPDTKTMSFTHGINLGKSLFDYHLNYGYSERDLRKIGDEYQRIYVGTNLSRDYLNERLSSKLHMTYTKLLDDEEPTDAWKLQTQDRGYKFTSSLDLEYNRNANDRYIASFAFDLNRKKYYKEKWNNDSVIDTSYVTVYDTTVSGIVQTDSMVIDTVAGYIGKMSEIGKEWEWNAKIQHKQKFETWGQGHQLLTGIELNYSINTGEGLVLDADRNYYGLYSTRRSYSFNDYPGLVYVSAYGEDNIDGKLFGNKYDMMCGLRYDAFNPSSPVKARNGVYLSPRFNFRYFLTDNLRFRIGVGQSVKAVSLGYLYYAPTYYKYVKYTDTDTSTVEEIQLQENPNLKAYTALKYESSIDWKVSKLLGLSLTSYYSGSHNRPVSVSYPWGYEINPDTITATSYSIYRNRGWEESLGFEFTLKIKRFYNIEYTMNVTYRFEAFGRTGLTYSSSPDTSLGETAWYKPYSTWREKVIIDYQINYLSKRLGIWVTLDVQQIPLEHRRNIYHTEPYDYTYTDGQVYTYYQGMTNPWERYLYDYSNRWLCNFRLSKSLSRNTDLSIYVNNIFDDRAVWTGFDGTLDELNPEIYYGLEISTQW